MEIVEVDARGRGKAAEGEALSARMEGAYLIACDEHGRQRRSVEFADHLAALRDRGERRLAFVVGGADGLDQAFLNAAPETLAFGPQTWPHALVRVLLAEQIYRALSILAGGPYHRE